MIVEPPLYSGAAYVTDTWPLPLIADPIVGALATLIAGTNGFDALDEVLVPMALVAVTVQVYVLPLVSPVTIIGLDTPLVTPVVPPSLEMQVAV